MLDIRHQTSEVSSLTFLRRSLTNICRLAIFFAFYNEIWYNVNVKMAKKKVETE